MANYSKLEIAKALARHSVEIGQPKQYAPNHLVPEGKLRVVGVKAKKISSQKVVLIVKFIRTPSLKFLQIQLFCTSLEEPKTKQGQSADWSLLSSQNKQTGCKITFWPWCSLQATLGRYS